MNTVNDREWSRFLLGHWTKEKPIKPGQYFTTPINGGGTGSEAVCYLDPETQEPKLAKPWGGYFWSEPTPEFSFEPEVKSAYPVFDQELETLLALTLEFCISMGREELTTSNKCKLFLALQDYLSTLNQSMMRHLP